MPIDRSRSRGVPDIPSGATAAEPSKRYFNTGTDSGNKKDDNSEKRIIQAFQRYLETGVGSNGSQYTPRFTSTSPNVQEVPEYTYNITPPEVPTTRQELWNRVISRRSSNGAQLPSQRFGGTGYGV